MPKGFTLLEILISMVILAIGLLGIADAQLNALRALRVQQTQQFFLQQFSNLSEQLAMEPAATQTLAHWQQSLQQHYPLLNIQIRPVMAQCFQIHLQWQQYQHNHYLAQIICKD